MNRQTCLLAVLFCPFAVPCGATISLVPDIPPLTIIENRADDASSGATRVADPGAGVTWYVKSQTFTLAQTEEIHNLYMRTDNTTANIDDMGSLTLEFFTATADVPNGSPGSGALFSQTDTFPTGAGLGAYLQYNLTTPVTLDAGSYALALSTNDMNLYFDIRTDNNYPNGTITRWNGTEWQVRPNDVVFALTGPAADPLKLVVDRGTGDVTMENGNSAGVDYGLDYYEIKSEAGSLNPSGWTSFADQNSPGFPAGDGSGNGWEEGGNNDSNQLIESYLLDSSTFTGGQSISMGSAFRTGATEDLTFLFHQPGAGGPTVGLVEYIGIAVVNGDFNNDGNWDCADINALTAEIAAETNGAAFDMNGDGAVTLADITDAEVGWLAVGGAENSADTGGNPFLEGDANLSGEVDVSDFNEWNSNKFQSVAAWCAGDFNADGSVDVSDFNLWNGSKFQSSDGVTAVPEPSSTQLAWFGLVIGAALLSTTVRGRSGRPACAAAGE